MNFQYNNEGMIARDSYDASQFRELSASIVLYIKQVLIGL